MTIIYNKPQDLLGSEGTDLGSTEWREISQERIDLFAEATGDYQWIHTDPDKAKDGPFGVTIAHGYLTLSLTNLFLPELLQVSQISMGINYGVNKVRFPSPVPVGSRVRASGTISEVTEISGGVQAIVEVTIEVEDSSKPACVVESISRFLN
ncbi:MAG: MaoC family dehydratase [Actinomycetota bacterium]|nr:MaoC family dehydratase [Actinomycetota bacterium]